MQKLVYIGNLADLKIFRVLIGKLGITIPLPNDATAASCR